MLNAETVKVKKPHLAVRLRSFLILTPAVLAIQL